MSSIDKVIEGFPYQTLPKIIGEPSYASIAELHQKLKANAASVQSNLGCSTLGHLWLTLKPEIYNTLSTVRFVPPRNPGAQPEIPESATAPQIASIRFEFEANQRIFLKYINVEQALKPNSLHLWMKSSSSHYGTSMWATPTTQPRKF